ncbi:hypothetical protein A2X44_03145 [candidate division CPR3 bacterium GWF2_35_18]|uniref:RNA polymerase sigma-70 factor, ECF subfamily n=1 Tax=candidate division CPR3 bacterium GW2011_GWF2_35_18 TaxID=1618350 RepID=A0A0G0EQ85_UNCC3|nr:MAG: RNA polymerase sigma-70 factor, ECF subfamily [candidate division CPR3 bacterium GW2011_GWF2_35_18]OGB62974.1 MAG: hypothetical protein A2X44_03145 [candidate division CPR3 bacterium GWF2_35_18]OGB65900.1 MAG: hypothetical protein A2250_03245 [candidate division CPR3 bacterium RIFOXYA2_FULL_35_13]OGB76726.1 MAG: hypothetical protein A2476_00435 [candidate division CPR3 bacterium RIFOXYC2_FULL_35_7]OGB78927.1 MAG: hypothetical protein A2296_00045 [candidate division CPR3 bacterium RIFOXY
MTFSGETEEKLIKEAKTNANAFAELYRRYVEKIYNFFYYHTFNISDTEDLTSVVFERVLTHLDDLKPGTNFSAWIFRIAHNCLVDFYRHSNKYKNQQNLEDIEVATEANIEHNLEKKEQTGILVKYLYILPDLYKEVLILKYHEELSNKEIGKSIGKSEGAVKQILRRALKELREKMPE